MAIHIGLKQHLEEFLSTRQIKFHFFYIYHSKVNHKHCKGPWWGCINKRSGDTAPAIPGSSVHALFLLVLGLTHVNTRSIVLQPSFRRCFTTPACHKVTETASLSSEKKSKK